MDSPKLIENLFYTITLVSTFTCIVRADYNFAFGLLCYYMIKTGKDVVQTARPVSPQFSYLRAAATDQRGPRDFRYRLVRDNEQRVGREALAQRERLESFRQHPLLHTAPLHPQHLPSGKRH